VFRVRLNGNSKEEEYVNAMAVIRKQLFFAMGTVSSLANITVCSNQNVQEDTRITLK
jgi:hypothetical protein